MSKEVTQIVVFISCPSDVEEEIHIVKEVCDDLTNSYGKLRSLHIKAIHWRSNVEPLITGEGVQSVIDKQVQENDYDIYIGIFWQRFGDEGPDGLTPTEHEFERAFERWQETGRPVIKIYFKRDKVYPTSIYDVQQLKEVLEFKERIKSRDLGIYDEFEGKEEFWRKIYNGIIYVVDNLSLLTSKNNSLPPIKFPVVSGYLQRKIIAIEKNTPESLFLWVELAKDIVDIVKQYNFIVLIGDAGVGKTIELKRVAWHFSNVDTRLHPLLVHLNKYTNQSLPQLLPTIWDKIPESQLLLLLDGLDEIEGKNKNDAIRQIELFAEQHPDSHLIVSCRTNFYSSETQRSSGTLSGFSSYVLLGLDSEEINKYIEMRL